MTRITLSLNQLDRDVEIDAERSLLSVLREELDLTGTKYGCGDGKCGACTVLVDGSPVQACSVAAVDVAGKRITTVEGLAAAGRLDAVQAAFVATSALQCGYCTPGMIMSATALLAANPRPERDRDRPRAARQHLPLRRAPAHRGGGAAGGEVAARRCLA